MRRRRFENGALGATLDGIVAHRAGSLVTCGVGDQVCVEFEGRERAAPLQREPAPRAGRQSIGARSEQRSGEAHDMVAGHRRERRAALTRGGAATLELAPRPPQLAAQPARELDRCEAARASRRPRAGHATRRSSGAAPRQRYTSWECTTAASGTYAWRNRRAACRSPAAVLGIGNLAKRRPLPGGAGDAGVSVGEKPTRADQLDRRQGAALVLPRRSTRGTPSGASE